MSFAYCQLCMNSVIMPEKAIFTLKVQTKGSTYKYRLFKGQRFQTALANHIRTIGKIDRAWIKCACHNIEEELQFFRKEV